MTLSVQLTLAILTALIPTVAVLIGIILQRQDTRDLRSEMRADMNLLRTEMRSDMDALRTELRTDMIALRDQVHADLLLIHERVAKVEARQGQ